MCTGVHTHTGIPSLRGNFPVQAPVEATDQGVQIPEDREAAPRTKNLFSEFLNLALWKRGHYRVGQIRRSKINI